MPTYSRAGQFGPAQIPGAPAGVPLRVRDATGSDAALFTDASKILPASPFVQSADNGNVSFFADPGTYTVLWTGGSTQVTVTGGIEEAAPGSQASVNSVFSLLTTGEEVVPRDLVQNEYPLDSGTCFFSYFTARKTEAITKLQTAINGTAASGLTVARVGVYLPSGGTLTQLAASSNDTSMWTATSTAYPKTLSSTFNKVAGQRYAVCLFATGSGMPVLEAYAARFLSVAQAPRIQGELAGQSNLPASVSEASLANSYRRFQAILLP